jgi:protein-arginine kinase activator protein McsA
MEKQNSSENTTSSSQVNEQSLTTSLEVLDKSQTPNKLHITILKVKNCHHSFKRVRPNQVECSKCGYGIFDSPEKPFVLTK